MNLNGICQFGTIEQRISLAEIGSGDRLKPGIVWPVVSWFGRHHLSIRSRSPGLAASLSGSVDFSLPNDGRKPVFRYFFFRD